MFADFLYLHDANKPPVVYPEMTAVVSAPSGWFSSLVKMKEVMHHQQTVEEFYARFTQIHTRCERDVHQMNQTKKLIGSSCFHFVGVTSCHASVKQRRVLMWLVACQVCNEALQTWRMFSDAGLRATATGENGESHSKPLSLIYDLLAVRLDAKEEKWWQDDKRKLQRKNFARALSLLMSLPPSPSTPRSSLPPVSFSGKVQKVKASLLSHRMSAVSVSTPQTWNTNGM